MRRPDDFQQIPGNAAASAVKTVVVLIVVVAVLAGLSTTWSIVRPGNTGVRVVLGKVNPKPLPPGFHMKLPLGIEKIESVQVWEQTASSELDSFSSDMQSIKVGCSVMYRILPDQVPVLYEQYSGTSAQEWYKLQIEPRVQEIVKQVTAMHRAQDLAQKRLDSKLEILKRLKDTVKTMEIRDFTINNIDLDPKLKDSIEQKMIADQKAQAKQYELIEAQKQAEITKVDADAKAQALRVTAEAVAENPFITLLEAVKKWDGRAPTTLVINGLSTASTSTTPVILPLK